MIDKKVNLPKHIKIKQNKCNLKSATSRKSTKNTLESNKKILKNNY
jgi:hypothetical protein